MILSSFLSILLSDTSPNDSSSAPRTEPACQTSLLSPLASVSVHYSVEDDAGQHRVIEHLQHGSANVEGSESPEKIQPALTFLKFGFCVFSPVQFVVYVDAQVLVLVHNVHLCSIDGEGVQTGPLFPKVHHQLLRLCDVELQVV